MTEYKVPIQSLIDHIRTATDVDPWAKDMAEDLLKKQEAVEPDTSSAATCTCGNCGETVGYYPVGCKTPNRLCRFCPECGQAVKWDV